MKIKNFKHQDIALIKRVLKYVLYYKLKLLLALICILGEIGSGIAVPLFWGKIIDNLLQKNMDGTILYIIFSLIFGILSNIISYFRMYTFTSLNQNIIFDLKNDMYKKLLDLPVKAYDEINNGEFMSRLHGDAGQVANAITGSILNSAVDLIRLIAVGITVFTINAKLALIVIGAFPLSFYIFNIYGKKIRINNKQLFGFMDKYFSDSEQAIFGIREIKSLGIKIGKLSSFVKLGVQLKKFIVNETRINAKSQMLSNIINTIAQMIVVFVGGVFVVNGSLEIMYFIAFNSYSGQFSSSIYNISKLNLDLQQVMNSLERIFLLMDGLSYPPEKFGEKSIDNIAGNIKFENVSFSYDAKSAVLDNVNINISAKNRVALVGSSGSGKTTMFNLLLKHYDPCKGRILIDSVDINEIKEEYLRKHISVVRQDPVLFSMSIKENLMIVNAHASQQEIESACKKAFIHDFIESLPDKYNSLIGENGVNLSGGQKQRIAIARALLKNSKIILFDEATSSLDNESQFYINKAINTIGEDCTVVTIAHRLSTIIDADIIYVLDQGKIAGHGNHHYLIRTNNIYKNLYESEVKLIKDNCKEVI